MTVDWSPSTSNLRSDDVAIGLSITDDSLCRAKRTVGCNCGIKSRYIWGVCDEMVEEFCLHTLLLKSIATSLSRKKSSPRRKQWGRLQSSTTAHWTGLATYDPTENDTVHRENSMGTIIVYMGGSNQCSTHLHKSSVRKTFLKYNLTQPVHQR